MKKLHFSALLLLLAGISSATPSLSGFSMVLDKPSYVLGEGINIMVNVYFAPGAPVYSAYVNISLIDPEGKTAAAKNCTTDEYGMCYVSHVLLGNQSTGIWQVFGNVVTNEFETNKTESFEVREMVCGDQICDAGELGFCETDCGKPNGEQCNQSSECNSEYCCHNTCRSSCPYCGDSYCDLGEGCSCPDCGACIEENDEVITVSHSGGFSSGTASMKLAIRDNNITAHSNEVFEILCEVETLSNSTVENATLMVSGINSTMLSIFPKSADISGISTFTLFVSIPSNFDAGNYSARIIALSSSMFSNPETLYFRVIPSLETPAGLVSCHGELRNSCPYCGDSHCDLGENCAICPEDCGECMTESSIGNRTSAEQILMAAKKKSESGPFLLFRKNIESAKEYIFQAEWFYIQRDYINCIELSSRAISIIESSLKRQWLIIGGSAVLVAFAVVFFSKFFNSR